MEKICHFCYISARALLAILQLIKFSDLIHSGAARRKKKKPTTFVPPPNLNMEQSLSNGLDNQISNTGLMSIPFWRRPVARSHTYGS